MYFPNGYSSQRAIQLAELVNQAYGQFEAFQQNRDWALPSGYELVSELRFLEKHSGLKPFAATSFDKELSQFAKSSTQRSRGLPIGFVAARKAEVFIVFRGTMTNAEWLHDFNIRLTAFPNRDLGKVHDGFLRTYMPFQPTIRESLLGKRLDGKLYITGHSLGAGLATLAAADLASQGTARSPIVYTFGSPRVGDKQFAFKYNELIAGTSFRIANTCDLVTCIPFPVPFLSFIGGYFTHVETPVEFTFQSEDAGRNHDMETYLSTLKAVPPRKGLFAYLFKKAPNKSLELTP